MTQKKHTLVELIEQIFKKNIPLQKIKIVAYILIGIVVIIGGYIYYNKYIISPKEEKASDAIFIAEKYFSADSFKIALNGNAQVKGFLSIIKNNGGTKVAKLAGYYAGICYLHLGDFNNAVKYLKDFSSDDKTLQIVAFGSLGDAYSELKKNKEAIEYYTKAGNYFDKQENLSGEYLFRAAFLNESIGNTKEALELYKNLKKRFPRSEKGLQVDKYIARLGNE